MTMDEKELHEALGEHMRRVKFWLRLLPRRATLHRYPVLNRFANGARKRSYLWSFRLQNTTPAIYAGCILTLLPLYGAQLIIAFGLALLLRANLPIITALQVISNPITVVPLWLAGYQTGKIFLGILGITAAPLQRNEVKTLTENFITGDWGSNFDRLITVFSVTSLGGLILGTFFGLIGVTAYRIIADRADASYQLLKGKLQAHKLHKAKNEKQKKANNGAT